MDEGIGALTRPDHFLLVWEDKHGVLDVVVALEVAAGLESHQSHAHSVELLYCLHLLLRNLNFFAANRIVGPNFLSVKSLTGLFADEALRRPQLFVVHSVHFLNAWLLRGDDRAEETQSDLGARGNTEQALAQGALLELFLPDPLHQLKNSRLGPFDTQ